MEAGLVLRSSSARPQRRAPGEELSLAGEEELREARDSEALRKSRGIQHSGVQASPRSIAPPQGRTAAPPAGDRAQRGRLRAVNWQ